MYSLNKSTANDVTVLLSTVGVVKKMAYQTAEITNTAVVLYDPSPLRTFSVNQKGGTHRKYSRHTGQLLVDSLTPFPWAFGASSSTMFLVLFVFRAFYGH